MSIIILIADGMEKKFIKYCILIRVYGGKGWCGAVSVCSIWVSDSLFGRCCNLGVLVGDLVAPDPADDKKKIVYYIECLVSKEIYMYLIMM